jgi:hypothetical protein
MLRSALALAGLLLLTSLPAQANFHGVAWEAQGLATDGARVALVSVAWAGAGCNASGCAASLFTVTLTDPATQAVLERRSFFGSEQFVTVIPISFTNGGLEELYALGASLDPAVAFTFSGNQVAQLTLQVLHQELEGSYRGWSFAVATPASHYETTP